jgi:hypothetical protein
MLVVGCRVNERVVIQPPGGPDVWVTFAEPVLPARATIRLADGSVVEGELVSVAGLRSHGRLGFEAPQSVRIYREAVYRRREREALG